MVILNDGKNRVRDLIDADKYQGQVGTSGTDADASDTGLGAAVAGTNKALTSSTANKQVVLDYNLLSTEGNGNTLKEYVTTLNSGTDFLTRITFPNIVKSSSIEIQISTVIDIP